MNNTSDPFYLVAAALGATGVGLGAYGAHGLPQIKLESWKTAVHYQLLHSVALLAVGVPISSKRLWAMGTTLFSGSIYMLCIGVGPKAILGPTTPIGGLLMIAGWIALAVPDGKAK